MIVAAGICTVAAALAYGSPTGTSQAAPTTGPAQHVLLISVDGLHQSDLRWWVRHHPDSVLARLARSGTQYTDAATPIPSDSFPGLVAQVTGGDPGDHGHLLRRHLQPPPAATRQLVHARPDERPRHRGQLRRGAGSQPELDRRRRRHPEPLPGPPHQRACAARPRLPDRAADDRPRPAADRSRHLQAGVPAPVPAREHDLPGRPRCRPAHSVGRQARRL